MKIQYGDKFKVIPKKFSVIKDIGKYFVSDKLRLTAEERVLLTHKLAQQEFESQFKELYNSLDYHIKDMIVGISKKGPLIDSVIRIKRKSQEPYCVIRFTNRVEVHCEELLFSLAQRSGYYKTDIINRSY